MDKLECLRTLTEDIVRKQANLFKSIDSICRRTDKVSVDISNLINSLQMVGNRQFAESRVHDDDSACGQSAQQQDTLNREGVSAFAVASGSGAGQEVPVSDELKLSSILVQALELVPCFDDTPPCITQIGSTQSELTRSSDSPSPSIIETSIREDKFELDIELGKGMCPLPESNLKSNETPSQLTQSMGDPPEKNRRVDRDRITNILKRYSLYDDAEDDDDDDDDDD